MNSSVRLGRRRAAFVYGKDEVCQGRNRSGRLLLGGLAVPHLYCTSERSRHGGLALQGRYWDRY